MAISNFERCVLNALRAVSSAALEALRTALEGYLLLLQAELAAVIAQAFPLTILRAKLQATANLVATVSDSVKAVSGLLPTGEVEVDRPCIQLSLLNLSVASSLSPITDKLDEIENDLLIVSSRLDLNSALQIAIRELIETINNLIGAIDEILNEAVTI